MQLGPEAVIGRMWSAKLRLNDPSISEAHAMISLRGTQLRLLSLRGRFSVDGTPTADVSLSRGQSIELGPRLRLEVEQVSIPTYVHAIRSEGMPLRALPPVASISARGDLEPGFTRDAAATLWIDNEDVDAQVAEDHDETRCTAADEAKAEAIDDVWIRRPHCDDERMKLGEAFDVGGQTFVLERMRVGEAAALATASSFDAPLTLCLLYDSVQIISAGKTASIDGIPARILCELAAVRMPVEWRTVAKEVWPREDDDALLRRNWDAGLARLRKALFERGLRGDLVRAAGRGRVSIFLNARDRIVDRQ